LFQTSSLGFQVSQTTVLYVKEEYKTMKVLFVSSECSPFASTGGLADVAGSLPDELFKHGCDIERIMPLYRKVKEGDFNLQKTDYIFDIPLGRRNYTAEVYYSDHRDTRTWFIGKDEFFDREHLYAGPDRDYDDNVDRFILFQKAVICLIDVLGKPYDVVHLNDWQTGLIPYFLKYGINGRGRRNKAKTLMTIHNLAYQGNFSADYFFLTNLLPECMSYDALEFFGNMNFFKGGLMAADKLNTVSETYAKEIQTEEFGCGLEGMLTHRKADLSGIVNGVDYTTWNPAVDTYLEHTYDAADLSGKEETKKIVLKEYSLPLPKKRKPLLGLISRFTNQKGLDLIAEVMDDIMKLDVQFVILGSGEEKYQEMAESWAEKYPEKCGVYIGFDVGLSHRIEAASDMFIMPSKFEPCGLNQLYSLKYGTIPVVSPTGGLKDTIKPVSGKKINDATGFVMQSISSEALLKSIKTAVKLYSDEAAWAELVQNAMAEDFSWEVSAKKYLSIYEDITA